ncbi:hypothetical protein ACU635_59955 [[Actinomadura] parvosata]|uniref:hypothetical protein n=1 Tax=[Actinomadura] parvosata TaxID=1955412 RepID=UPI00406CBCBE
MLPDTPRGHAVTKAVTALTTPPRDSRPVTEQMHRLLAMHQGAGMRISGHTQGSTRVRRTAAVLAGMVLAGTCLALGSGPAGAAGPCGSGYRWLDRYPIGRAGSIHLYYNPASGKNCALTYAKEQGRKESMAIKIGIAGAGTWADFDHGMYRYYAGPVYVSARNKCITLHGLVGQSTRFVKRDHCD